MDTDKKIASERSFHVSQAALDLNARESDVNRSTQLWIKDIKSEYLLATLSSSIPQEKLDLAFEKHEEITFYRVGEGSVYLSGYYIPEENSNEQQLTEVCRCL